MNEYIWFLDYMAHVIDKIYGLWIRSLKLQGE